MKVGSGADRRGADTDAGGLVGGHGDSDGEDAPTAGRQRHLRHVRAAQNGLYQP